MPAVTPTFFKHTLNRENRTELNASYFNVGGDGDCGFRSVAAGIIDSFKSVSKYNHNVLKQLLEAYYKHFPQYKPSQGYLTPSDHMQFLMRNVSMPELVVSLGYALRQIAVNEMCSNPATYQGAFIKNNEHTSPAEMRQQKTWIDESSIAALAYGLDIPINISVVHPRKELPLTLSYNSGSEAMDKPEINIKLENNHYVPKIKHTKLFQSINQRKLRDIPPHVSSYNDDMALILAKIANSNEEDLNTFNQAKRTLESAVLAGELNQGDLMDLYISGMKTSDYLDGRVKYIGLEHGHQRFFDALTNRQQGSANDSNAHNYQKLITKELIHALSRAVTIGDISEEQLFNKVEQKQQTRQVSL